jgi:hypothetical protein
VRAEGIGMSTSTATVRETVDDLGRRLERVCAAASSLRSMSADIRYGVPPADLLSLLDQIDRELLLATHQVAVARERAKLELDSLRRSDETR